jgi:hypothetical protein
MIHELIYAAYYAMLIREYQLEKGTPPDSFLEHASVEAFKVANQYRKIFGAREISIF